MSSAVHDLQMAILDGTQSITQLLRRTKIIAAKLGLADFERWVDSELNGYPNDIEPPKYRTLTTNSITVYNPYRGWEFGGNYQTTIPCRWPIADIEAAVGKENLALPLPDGRFEDCLGDVSTLPRRVLLNGARFLSILEAIKNDLVQWTVELDKRGIKGEGMNFDEKEKRAAASQVFNNCTVHGTFGNTTNSQVTLYDSSVNQLLVDHKIPKQDRRELEDIIDDLKEAPPEKKASFHARAEKWLVKHKEALGVGAELVGKVICAARDFAK